MKIIIYSPTFQWNLLSRMQWTRSQHWFRHWLSTCTKQVASHHLNQSLSQNEWQSRPNLLDVQASCCWLIIHWAWPSQIFLLARLPALVQSSYIQYQCHITMVMWHWQYQRKLCRNPLAWLVVILALGHRAMDMSSAVLVCFLFNQGFLYVNSLCPMLQGVFWPGLVIAIAWCTLVCFSRIYLGMHSFLVSIGYDMVVYWVRSGETLG